MFTFDLCLPDGTVWLTVSIRGDSVTDAASKIGPRDLIVVWN